MSLISRLFRVGGEKGEEKKGGVIQGKEGFVSTIVSRGEGESKAARWSYGS